MNVIYPAERTVSIWVGDFQTEGEFDRSIDDNVAKRLGLGVPIAFICEVTFEAKSRALRELLEGFSGWESFVEAAAHAGKERGVGTANAVLVCYYLKCERPSGEWGTLRFLGNFERQDV